MVDVLRWDSNRLPVRTSSVDVVVTDMVRLHVLESRRLPCPVLCVSMCFYILYAV